ncbi:MAG: efflux transporter outer membrane subunit [Syntrophobacteraceae bacterium]
MNTPKNMCCSRWHGFLLLLLLLVAGCAKVGPNYSRPATEMNENWLEAQENRIKTGPREYRAWWQVFKDPILDRLIETAYRENLNLRVAGLRVLEARAQLGAAVGQLYPQTQQATGSVENVRESQRVPASANFSETSLGVTATWEIDFWGKFRRAVESADANLMASVADYDNILVSLTGNAASLYVVIRTLERRLIIAHHNVETQRRSLEIARYRFEGGTTSKRDVEQARALLASTEATVPALQIQLRQAQDALSVLLGMPPSLLAEQLHDEEAEIPAPPAQVVVGIPVDLLRRRPDVRAAEYNAMAQCSQIGVSKAQLYPALSLLGSFGFQSSTFNNYSLGDMFLWSSRASSIGPSVAWNIFNYGQLTNQVRVQDARFQELLVTYQNAVLSAQQDVEDNLTGFLRSEEEAGSLRESAEAAQSSLDLAVIQYSEGITDFTTVLTAQQSLLSAEDSLASALGNISTFLVGVYRALGGGWEIREGQDFVPVETRELMEKRTNWGGLLTPKSGPPPTPEQQEQKPLIRTPEW